MAREGQLKARFGLNRDLVGHSVARPCCDSTAVSTMRTFLESIIDSMVDRLDEKQGDFCRVFIGRVFPGYE